MSLKNLSTALLLAGLVAATSCGDNSSKDNSGRKDSKKKWQSKTAGITGSNLPGYDIQAYAGKENQLAVTVTIPPRHHAYLDRGKEGNLIPITFYWEGLLKTGTLKKKPTLKSGPPGRFYSVAKATVLRGQGTFFFTLDKDKWPVGRNFRVRSQICNEDLGICYPPAYKTVEIK